MKNCNSNEGLNELSGIYSPMKRRFLSQPPESLSIGGRLRRERLLRKMTLEDMADYVDEDLDLSYHSDQEFFREFDYKKSDLLGYYCKSGRACDIELMINGVRKKYRDVNIHFAENGYEVNHDDVKDFFSLENVYDIKPDM